MTFSKNVIKINDKGAFLIFILISTSIIIIGLTFFQFPLEGIEKSLISVPLFSGLILLITGYGLSSFSKARYIRALGWLIFAFYWSTQINTLYYYENGDIVNSAICTLGVYLLVYFSYKDITTNEDCLEWLAGAGGVSGILYFTMEYIPMIKYGLIYMVARHSADLFSIFNNNIRVSGSFIWAGYDLIEGSPPTAEIIFACTAIQSILLFVGLILPIKEVDLKRRLIAILLLIPTIYFLNLIRNASVVYLVGYRITSMNIAHNYIGKTGSLIALIVLVFLVFRYIPELYDKIICTINLYRIEGAVERGFKKIVGMVK